MNETVICGPAPLAARPLRAGGSTTAARLFPPLVIAAVAAGAWLPSGAAAAKVPTAVTRAAHVAVAMRTTAGASKTTAIGYAVATGDGRYVTATALTSRASIQLGGIRAKSDGINTDSTASKVPLSDAPTGLQLIATPSVDAVSSARATFAGAGPKRGDRLWLLTPSIHEVKRHGAVTKRSFRAGAHRITVGESSAGLLTLSSTSQPRQAGAPIVDDLGRIRAIAVPPENVSLCTKTQLARKTDRGTCAVPGHTRMQAIALDAAPRLEAATAPAKGPDFPAVPAAAGIGILLLLSRLGLALSGRRRTTPTGVPVMPAAAPAPAPVVDDGWEGDLEITLRR